LTLLEEKVMDTTKTEEEQTAKGIMALLGHHISHHDEQRGEHQVSLNDLLCSMTSKTKFVELLRTDVTECASNCMNWNKVWKLALINLINS